MAQNESDYEFYVGPATHLEGASLAIDGPARIDGKIVGKVAELTAHLPVTFEFDRQQYELRFDQSWRLRPMICPHLLGPLEPSEQSDSILRCPWHGYEFDVESGVCLSPSTATCKLKPLPLIEERDGELWVVSA